MRGRRRGKEGEETYRGTEMIQNSYMVEISPLELGGRGEAPAGDHRQSNPLEARRRELAVEPLPISSLQVLPLHTPLFSTQALQGAYLLGRSPCHMSTHSARLFPG